MNRTLAKAVLLAGLLLTPGCIQQETTHTWYLSPAGEDGANPNYNAMLERFEARFGRVPKEAVGRYEVWKDSLSRMDERWLGGRAATVVYDGVGGDVARESVALLGPGGALPALAAGGRPGRPRLLATGRILLVTPLGLRRRPRAHARSPFASPRHGARRAG